MMVIYGNTQQKYLVVFTQLPCGKMKCAGIKLHRQGRQLSLYSKS